jgi:hypothetical protein
MTNDVDAEEEDLKGALNLSGTLSIHMSVGLAHDHLRSACRFARYAYALEHGGSSLEAGMEREEHDTFVISAVVFAAAFLESEVNTLFAEAAEGFTIDALRKARQEPLRERMAEFFRAKGDFRKLGSLLKYQHLLKLAEKSPLSEKAGTPHQRALFLLQIRNRLIHFQEGPVLWWSETSEDIPPGRFEDELAARGISRSPLAPSGEPFFPRGMLSHDLAARGIEWAVAWVDAFYEAFGAAPPPLDSIRAEIRTTT